MNSLQCSAVNKSFLSDSLLGCTGPSMRREERKRQNFNKFKQTQSGDSLPSYPCPALDKSISQKWYGSIFASPTVLFLHTHPCLCSPVPMLLHTKRDFMSISLLHCHRDRPREAENIVIITQIILSKCPRFLIVRDAGSWTSHSQFTCPSIRIRHEASAGF